MLPSIAKLASKHGIAPLKKYGQNFIFDETLCDKIVSAASLPENPHILEIGPGPAGLTRSILKTTPKKLTVIETDSRCMPLLEEIKEHYPALEIIQDDATKIALSDIAEVGKLNIISNLPYNVGTNLLIGWIMQLERVRSMTLMLQREVVDRIVSQPGKKSYGRLSVICQLTCNVHKCFDVSPKAFYPEPKIWSSIVHLIPKQDRPNIELLTKIEKITNAAFSERRKMIRSSLKKIFPDVEKILESLGLDPKLRAENLQPEDFLRLGELL